MDTVIEPTYLLDPNASHHLVGQMKMSSLLAAQGATSWGNLVPLVIFLEGSLASSIGGLRKALWYFPMTKHLLFIQNPTAWI